VLGTDEMGGIREIRTLPGGGGVAVVGPAASVEDLEKAAAAQGLFYAPDPTEREAWLGGTVATNASGGRTFRYGPTRRQVRRLKVALATGELVDLPRGRYRASADGTFSLPLARGGEVRGRLPSYTMPAAKNASGYYTAAGMDLLDLFIGSEGTLGLVTGIELTLLPVPQSVLAGIVFFDEERLAWAFLQAARSRSYASRGFAGPAPSDPASPGASVPAGGTAEMDARVLESFDGAALDFMRRHQSGIPPEARAAIYFEQETREETQSRLQDQWLKLAEEGHALVDDSWFADGEAGRKRFREFRHALPVAINDWLASHGQEKIAGDMAVPDAAFQGMMAVYREVLDGTGLAWLSFGHLGNNHLHVNLLPRDDGEAARAREVYRKLVEWIVGLGGTVSAEHGLGKIKARHLAAMYGEEAFAEMTALKRAFDPALILGRGNIIPEEHLD
jgi:D-lactate dehydrogenase (cytochrome)